MKTELFTKNVATFEDISSFADKLTAHSFKKSVTLNEKNYSSKDTLIAYTGTTQKGDLIAIWSRIGSKRKSADYGIRISEELVKKLTAKSEALKILLSQYTNTANYEDSNEYRVSFTDIHDVDLFLNTLFAYTAQKAVKAVNESEMISA